MADIAPLKVANFNRWKKAKITRGPELVPVAKRLVGAKARYQTVEARTGVPWPFIAVTHQRESSQDWSKSLAQGDPWIRVSTHVPAGRGPFSSWEDAAYDALVNCGPYAARNKDWTIGGTLTLLEQYNGIGYYKRGIPSPYIWSGTDQYVKGKYIADGVFDPNVVDKQLGCAGLIYEMMKLDPYIKFVDSVISEPEPVPAGELKDSVWLQNCLNRLGANPPLEVDGIIGAATKTAIKALQKSQGLAQDGIAGPLTILAIERALAAGKPI